MTTEMKMEIIQNMIENLQKVSPHYDYDWEIQMTLDNCLGGLITLMGCEINKPAEPRQEDDTKKSLHIYKGKICKGHLKDRIEDEI